MDLRDKGDSYCMLRSRKWADHTRIAIDRIGNETKLEPSLADEDGATRCRQSLLRQRCCIIPAARGQWSNGYGMQIMSTRTLLPPYILCRCSCAGVDLDSCQDAAEMYPVPTKKETQGRTEIALGKWLKTRNRHDMVVATKVRRPVANVKNNRDVRGAGGL